MRATEDRLERLALATKRALSLAVSEIETGRDASSLFAVCLEALLDSLEVCNVRTGETIPFFESPLASFSPSQLTDHLRFLGLTRSPESSSFEEYLAVREALAFISQEDLLSEGPLYRRLERMVQEAASLFGGGEDLLLLAEREIDSREGAR